MSPLATLGGAAKAVYDSLSGTHLDDQMAGLKLTLLGGFEVASSGGERLSLSTRKAKALLAYLALRPGQAHSREKIAGLL